MWILFTGRFISNLLLFLFVTLPLELVGMIVLVIVLPFVARSAVQLPAFVRWFDNFESYYLDPHDPSIDGLSGPDYYRQSLGLNTSFVDGYDTDAEGNLISRTKLFLNRFNWLALRNPLNYFQYKYLGARLSVTDPIIISGVNVHDVDDGGYYYATSSKYYEYYYVKPYSFLGFTSKFRFRMGHKISSSYKEYQQWVFIINPFFHFSKN